MMAGKTFSSIQEELEFYKSHAGSLELTVAETQATLEEFQLTSKDLEEDLERELEQAERRCRELRSKNEQLKDDVDSWKQKYYQAKSESNVNLTQMQRELDQLRSIKEKYMVETRNLELDNDELERDQRAARSSLADLEIKYNRAIERSAILESELEGKTQLIVQVQRLKDELEDCRIELAVLRNKQDGDLGPPTAPAVQRHDSRIYARPENPQPEMQSEMQPEMQPESQPGSQPGSRPESRPSSAMSLDNSQSSNPVKMVQEMVGRVKSLEARLVSCRSLVTPLLAPPPSYSTTMPLPVSTPPKTSPNVSPAASPFKGRTDSSLYRTPSKSYRRTSSRKDYSFPVSPIKSGTLGRV
jgi:DNA repair exonuclease SbcCD ATPase subunit